MEDKAIVELYWERRESAISESAGKYGAYLGQIARNILSSHEDCEECVNDAYLKAWNSIPPAKPDSLKAFLGKIARNLALDRYRAENAKKRGEGNAAAAIDELSELSDGRDMEESLTDRMVLKPVLEGFLRGLKDEERRIFLKRYWYFMSVKNIAEDMQLGESKVKMTLLRSRGKLKEMLEREGIGL